MIPVSFLIDRISGCILIYAKRTDMLRQRFVFLILYLAALSIKRTLVKMQSASLDKYGVWNLFVTQRLYIKYAGIEHTVVHKSFYYGEHLHLTLIQS